MLLTMRSCQAVLWCAWLLLAVLRSRPLSCYLAALLAHSSGGEDSMCNNEMVNYVNARDNSTK